MWSTGTRVEVNYEFFELTGVERWNRRVKGFIWVVRTDGLCPLVLAYVGPDTEKKQKHGDATDDGVDEVGFGAS